jgi:hypothetical protein
MKAKVLNDAPERTIALIFEQGDEVMEVLLTESPAYLKRVCDPRSGIALIRVDA